MHRGHGPIHELDDRTIDRVADAHRRGLPGVLELDLRADRDELPEDDHRRRIHGAPGEAGRPRPSVDEAEPARAVRVREHGAAPDRILQVLRGVGVLLVGGVVTQFVQESPPFEPEVVDDLAELRGLLTEAFGDHEARPSAQTVRRHPRQVSEGAHLRVPFRRLARDRHGDAPDDQGDLLGRRSVLQMLEVLVERDLFLEPSDLVGVGMVGREAEVPANDVREEHAQGLRRSPGRADRACVVQLDVRSSVPARAHVHLREALERGDQDALRQDRESDPQRRVDPVGDRAAVARVLREAPGDRDRDLLAGHARRELPDLDRDPLDPEMAEQLLHPGCHVLRPRDLGNELRVESFAPGVLGDPVGPVDLGLDRAKIRFHESSRGPFEINPRREIGRVVRGSRSFDPVVHHEPRTPGFPYLLPPILAGDREEGRPPPEIFYATRPVSGPRTSLQHPSTRFCNRSGPACPQSQCVTGRDPLV